MSAVQQGPTLLQLSREAGKPFFLSRLQKARAFALDSSFSNADLAPMRFAPLPRSFYEPSAQVVAAKLIGHFLIRTTSAGVCGGPIVETEAYLEGDPACHAACGLTQRNRVMFGPPGHAYVYFIYGAHYCVNAVCRPAGQAEAVLIRAIEPAIGIGILQNKRPRLTQRELTNGPAKLCEAMAIDRSLDGTDLCDPTSPLLIASNSEIKSFVARSGPVVTTPRIGITRAAERPLRFLLKGNEFVSRPSRKRSWSSE